MCVAHVRKPQADVRDPAVNSLPYSLQCFSLMLEVTALVMGDLGKHVVTEISPFSWIPQQSHYCPTHGMSTSSSSLLSSLGFLLATQNLSSLYNTLTPLSCGLLFLSLVNVSAWGLHCWSVFAQISLHFMFFIPPPSSTYVLTAKMTCHLFIYQHTVGCLCVFETGSHHA